MPKELEFSDFLSGQTATEEPQDVDTSVTDDAQLQVETNQATETTEETSDTAVAEGGDEGQEQVAPSQPEVRVLFEDVLKRRGVSTDDVDPEELYEHAAERLAAAGQMAQEVEQLRAELEALRRQAPAAPQDTTQQSAAPSEPETPAQARARRFRELHKPDSTLESYVTRNEHGLAVPKTEYGSVSVDAARQINEYERAEREQAELLLSNPSAIIEDNLDLIEKIAEEKARLFTEQQIKAIREEQDKAAQARTAEEQKAREESLLQEWHDTNYRKIFRTSEDGSILSDPFNPSAYAKTQFGRNFFKQLQELRAEIPNAPELKLRTLAMQLAESAMPQEPQVQPAAQQPPAQPVQTQAEKKRTLADERQVVPNQNTPAAPAASNGRQLRFMDIATTHPENAERFSRWR